MHSGEQRVNQGRTMNTRKVFASGGLLAALLLVLPATGFAQGNLVAWGDNTNGQATIPAGLTNVTRIAAGGGPGGGHNLAVRSDGTLVAWGANFHGQTTIPAGLTGIINAIAAGGYHSLALKSDGTVAAWGFSGSGVTAVPAGLSGVTAIAAGKTHSLALRSSGTVAAWGFNGNGETTIPAGLTEVTAVAASNGGFHNLALRSDGTVVGWGSNFFGQTTIPAGLSGVTAIAAGGFHSLALRSNGTVVAWGNNANGRSTVPAGLSGVTAIAAGYEHSVALRSDGTLVIWGSNNFGQLNVPAGLCGITAIAAGELHTLALRRMGLGCLVVDDGATNSRPVARNQSASGSVWNSLSQTFTARWPRMTFGFRLFNRDSTTGALLPDAGKLVVMNLYSGENSYSNLLASRTVAMPAELSTDSRRNFGDVGFVVADFSAVALAVGGRYTVEITLPPGDLPASGQRSNINVWTSLANPYPDGRFYFRCCYDNSAFASQDMLFTMNEVAASGPVAAVEAVEEDIVGALDRGAISPSVATMLLDLLGPIQVKLAWIAANPTSPDRARMIDEACTLINSFNARMDHLVRDRRLSSHMRYQWRHEMLLVKADLGCRF